MPRPLHLGHGTSATAWLFAAILPSALAYNTRAALQEDMSLLPQMYPPAARSHQPLALLYHHTRARLLRVCIAQATAKKSGDLLKFGGGFYAGKIPAPKSDEGSGWLSSVVLALYALLGK